MMLSSIQSGGAVLRFLAVCAFVLVGPTHAAEEVGIVMFATSKCVLINGALTFAIVTGSVEAKKGDTVSGDFRFQSYTTLRDASGRTLGTVWVEDTTIAPSQVPKMMESQRGKCV